MLVAFAAPIGARAETDAVAPPLGAKASGATCSATVAARVQRYYDSVEDLAADFEQTTRSVLFDGSDVADAETARGRMVLAKPGRMRWSYTEPEESLVVSDGTTLWLYSPAQNEAQRLPMTEGYLTGAALSFLLGDGKLLEAFQVEADACGTGKPVELALTPLQPASYERLGLTVVESTGEVLATAVVDLFGNETRIAFEHLKRNQHPPKSVFEFEPGPGVSVVEVESP